MESLVALLVLAALISAFLKKAKLATLLLGMGLVGILVLLACHATNHLNLLF